MTRQTEYVWLSEDGVYAEVISLGAYASVVRYVLGGVEYEVVVSNDEFEYFGEDDDDEG